MVSNCSIYWPYFFGIYRSVIVPSAISAAKLKVSGRVGCGCTVSAMSSMSAPISNTSTAGYQFDDLNSAVTGFLANG